MHRAEHFEELFFIEKGIVTRLVKGFWKGVAVAIFKENDLGQKFVRNYDCIYGCGWLMSIPGEDGVEKEKWFELKQSCSIFMPCDLREGMRELNVRRLSDLIVSRYPNFSYCLKKYTPKTTESLMKTFSLWKKYPDIEFLLAGSYFNLAYNRAFLKLSKSKKQKYLAIMKKCKDNSVTFEKLKFYEKYGFCEENYKEWKDFQHEIGVYVGISYPIFRYLEGVIKSDTLVHHHKFLIYEHYCDYYRMAKEAGKNMKDPYWKFPKDLNKAHNKVVREVNNIREAKRLAALAKQKEIESKTFEDLKKIAGRFSEFSKKIDGFEIFVSSEMNEWERHAKALNQCICAAGYYKKMAAEKEIIVFIQKDSEPVATAEIFEKKKIGQFYANELDRKNCLPSEEVKNAFNTWLSDIPEELFSMKKSA